MRRAVLALSVAIVAGASAPALAAKVPVGVTYGGNGVGVTVDNEPAAGVSSGPSGTCVGIGEQLPVCV